MGRLKINTANPDFTPQAAGHFKKIVLQLASHLAHAMAAQIHR
ncbi:MAG: hypothetical protein O9262_14830 [Cyclobacteriaceae bacterium]|nr:hypothetical protein [Cyclobacteriaceae bacterium]